MAEETLVKEQLTAAMIQGGDALIHELDEIGWPVLASLWLFEPSENQWRLIIASPKVNVDGPRQAYDAISQALTALQHHFTELQFISVVAPEHPLIRTLSQVFATGVEISGKRLSRSTIGGRFIDDAYIYRLNNNPAAAQVQVRSATLDG